LAKLDIRRENRAGFADADSVSAVYCDHASPRVSKGSLTLTGSVSALTSFNVRATTAHFDALFHVNAK
jgi:hypothetical protein